MKIQRLNLLYIFSLLVLGAFVVLVLFRPLATGGGYSTVQKEQLLKTRDGWIIQFDLVNQEGKDIHCRLNFIVDGSTPYEEAVLVPAGGIYTYTHHVGAERVSEGKVQMTVFRDGETKPLEKTIYYLK